LVKAGDHACEQLVELVCVLSFDAAALQTGWNWRPELAFGVGDDVLIALHIRAQAAGLRRVAQVGGASGEVLVTP
jgi:hypothetical protein